MNAPLKILITGATGFIGRHVLPLLDDSKFQVRIITRSESPQFNGMIQAPEIFHGDICNRSSLSAALAGMDVVVHLAAELKDVSRMTATNTEVVRHLVEDAAAAGVKRIIHLSSVGVTGMQYSKKPCYVTEETECHPMNEYERTKLQAERILLDSEWNRKGQLVILRPTNVFGEHHPANALLNLFRHIGSGRKVFSAHGAMVNYVYVKDLARLITDCITNEMHYTCYQVGAPQTMEAFIGQIATAEQVRTPYRELPRLVLSSARMMAVIRPSLRGRINSLSNKVQYLDNRLRAEFDYPFGNSKGIAATVEYYRSKGLLQ